MEKQLSCAGLSAKMHQNHPYLYTHLGQLLHTFSNLDENTYMELNTTNLNKGIYFVVAYTSDGKKHNAKFVKE
jgi:hypothetical protein